MSCNVLYATAEASPLASLGGLGEFCGSLPAIMRKRGVDARLLLPAYLDVVAAIAAKPIGNPLKVLPGFAETVQLFEGALADGTPVYAIDCPSLYQRQEGIYGDADGNDWPDNALRFGVLSKVAALFGSAAGLGDWRADIIHCNDWHTGLAPAFLLYDPEVWARSVFSIHNPAFQGNFSPHLLPALGLPWSCFAEHGVEFYGQLSFLKAGLYYADTLVTVSPTYAQEIQTPEFGFGMEGVIAYKRNRLTGILNGIDEDQWDPRHDAHLPAHYGPDKPVGKAVNKQILQEQLGLEPKGHIPLLGMIGRFTYQKGVDLVLDIGERLLQENVQLAVLGSGDRNYEVEWRRFARGHPGRVSVTIGYDTPLAHLIEAGADIFLMPSRFEPCGLNQMYSLRYGTPPIVRYTGGLADSVVDTTPRTLSTGAATGFTFESANAAELYAAILRALLVFADKKSWEKIQINGMKKEFSWDASAAQYLKLYENIMPK